MKYMLALICMLPLVGCSVISPKVGPKAAKAVNHYCLEPFSARLILREEVNRMIDPNKVKIDCAGDPQ